MTGIDEGIFERYVFAKLAEAPALARSYTEIKGRKLRYESKQGVIISNTENVSMERGIIHIRGQRCLLL
jgi:hypothetical protein